MDQRILDLQGSLLKSINETFVSYKTEAQRVLDQTVLSTMQIINTALVTSDQANGTDTQLRYLIKKSLAQTVALKDIGLFDNAILDYYRYTASPIEKITIVSLLPLKVALHFPQVSIEGLVCDNQFSRNDARLLCNLYNNRTSSTYPNFKVGVAYNRSAPACQFRTKLIQEAVPCSYLISKFKCTDNSRTYKDCAFERITAASSNICQNEGQVNLFC